MVDSEWLPGGGLQLRVTLLAAGFVIGASGASVREITQHTGAMIQSWTQQPQPGRYHRPTRVFRVTGPRKSVAAASEIVHQAVERYKELCEGKRRGEFVQRQQRIRGVEFSYQPPPRSAAPQAAALGGGRPPQQHHAGAGEARARRRCSARRSARRRWRTSDTWAPFRRAWAVDITWAARGAWTRRDWRCSPRAAGLFRRRRRPPPGGPPVPGDDAAGGASFSLPAGTDPEVVAAAAARGGRGGRGAAAATIGAARARPYAGGVRAVDAHAAARRTTTVRGGI